MANETVIFKGRKDGLFIILSEDAAFDIIKDALRKKAARSKKFFGSAVTAVIFQGRELSSPEEEELMKIILDETNITVSEHRTESKKIIQTNIAEEIKREPEINYGNAFFHKGSLRSGQAINFKGNVVVVGDVNPGGEIIAEGNVIVLGAIKGMVHAGCGGDRSSFVFSLKFSPTQLRIADTISYIPPEFSKKGKGGASYAYVEEGQIYIKQM